MFEKRFKNLLLEAPEDVAELSPVDATELAPDTDTIDAIDDVPTNPAINYKKEMTAAHTEELKTWIVEIEHFKNYLNGTDGASLQAKINGADCDTLFNEISRSETKKIARIAQDLSALVESLKGYLLAHEDD